nr:MAG TPA: hypothetical protein [Caudoviricetes sp.]
MLLSVSSHEVSNLLLMVCSYSCIGEMFFILWVT